MRELVDNFKQIKDLLPSEPAPDTFWVIRVISRRKDNPDLCKNSKFVKSYTVQCKDDLDKLRGSIIESCQKYNARGYFDPNARSWRKVALATLKRTAEYIASENYSSVMFAADRCLDQGAAPGYTKIWVIDLDEQKQEDVTKSILKRMSVPVIAEVPTPNGKHLLTHPFNLNDMWYRWHYDAERPEIKKNNHTLLYFNKMLDNEE
ncbi:MAG: hypothetical protein J6T83_01220 [Paludibacteraceae bacterium]|nr:hypothetical protein [Paludibacteraceae bacterium]